MTHYIHSQNARRRRVLRLVVGGTWLMLMASFGGCGSSGSGGSGGETPPPGSVSDSEVDAVVISGVLPGVSDATISRSVLVDGSAATISSDQWTYAVPMSGAVSKTVTVDWLVNGRVEVSRDVVVDVAP